MIILRQKMYFERMMPETMDFERMTPETMDFERMTPETMWGIQTNKTKGLLQKIKDKKKAILIGTIPLAVAATAVAAHKYIKNKKRNDTKTTKNI